MSELSTLQSLIDSLLELGDQPAVLALHKEGIERWSYAELADHVQQLACGLAETGVGGGDHVALLAPNRPEWIVACLAVIEAGAVVVPLDVQFGDEELATVLKDSDARFIFTTAEGAMLLDVGEDDERSWRCLLTDQGGELPQVEADDPAALFYTSGTTGTAKGVPLTHGNLVFQPNTLLEEDLLTEDDRV